jgi:phospholipid transport system transporter-binding protein
VSFATVGDLLQASPSVFVGQAAITVDLSGVTSVDSAGLALLLEWLRRARSDGYAVAFTSLPDKLVAIAKLSGVDVMLAAGYTPAG